MKETAVLGVRLTVQDFDAAVSSMIEAAKGRVEFRAHFATVHSVVEAHSNAQLREVFASASMVCTDGLPLVWIARLRGVRGQRVCGPDVLLALCDRGRASNLRHHFVGGAPGIAAALSTNLAAMFPGLIVTGTDSPPFRQVSAEEDDALVKILNESRPDVVWVGLGSPKQEFWAAEHAPRLTAPLLLPIGAAFDFYSGRVRRAPRWIRRLGLEWLFRLAMEPRRLWRRYLTTNLRFVWLVLREELSRRRSPAGRH